jgi:hypothetical protein
LETQNYYLTHFYRRSPNPETWIQTNFITRVDGQAGIYYLGIKNSSYPLEKIRADIENGSLIEVPVELSIQKGETVWITPEQEVYIGDKYYPFDNETRLVYRDNISTTYDIIEKGIQGLVACDESNFDSKKLDEFMARDYWKTFVGLLAMYLNNKMISEDIFYRFGYLFSEMDTLYNYDFLVLLNRLKMAYTPGKLRFEYGDEFVQWNVIVERNPEKIRELAQNPIYFEEYAEIEEYA